MKVKFCVLGEPKGKGRPRVSTRNGFARAYTPKDTANYENLVRYTYQSDVGIMLQGDITARITAYFPIPKSVSKKQRQMMLDKVIPHTKKVDCDNIAKIILDSLNEVAYDDDKQIYRIVVEKWYSDVPRVEVELEERGAQP